jgi:hypothetical protein
VERDLGAFREQLAHLNHDIVQVHDDFLILRLCGPTTAAEFDKGSTSASGEEDAWQCDGDDLVSRLPDFTRECAGLWRELYGARFGHFNAAATAAAALQAKKRSAAAGTVRGMVGGVLAAARSSVLAKRRRPDRPSRVDDENGAGTSRSDVWNKPMEKLQHRSRFVNIPGCSTARAAPGAPFVVPARINLGKLRAAKPARPASGGVLQYNKVALLGVDPAECPVNGCPRAEGLHSCAEGAALVVVRDLAILHDVATLAADEGLAIRFLYVVLRGLDVTTQPQLKAARGDPRRLPPAHCLGHVPASSCGKTALRFWIAPAFAVEQAAAYKALRKVAAAPGATVAVEKKAPPAGGAPSGVVCIRSLRELVAWAVDARKVENVRGPKAFNTSCTGVT